MNIYKLTKIKFIKRLIIIFIIYFTVFINCIILINKIKIQRELKIYNLNSRYLYK